VVLGGHFCGARLKSEQNKGLLGVSGPLLRRQDQEYAGANESCLNDAEHNVQVLA
jgi:hypothetical protein